MLLYHSFYQSVFCSLFQTCSIRELFFFFYLHSFIASKCLNTLRLSFFIYSCQLSAFISSFLLMPGFILNMRKILFDNCILYLFTRSQVVLFYLRKLFFLRFGSLFILVLLNKFQNLHFVGLHCAIHQD